MQPVPSFSGVVEFAAGFAPRPAISHVLLDFDGTLSLIRQGWPEGMVPMLVEIMRLNGKQTIYQMIQLAERIQERGGQPKKPLWYKHEYLRRLEERIRSRLEDRKSTRLN